MKKTCAKKRPNIFTYIKAKKIYVALYIFFVILHEITNMYSILEVSRFVSLVSDQNYNTAITSLIIFSCVLIGSRILYMLAAFIYIKTMAQISLEIKQDLAVRSFSLTSKTISGSGSGQLITRITRDPDEAMGKLGELVESASTVITYAITVIYIAFLNAWIALTIIAAWLILFGVETIKVRLFMRNTEREKAAYDSTVSLTNEVIKSEKDIKGLNLENELGKTTYQNYLTYKKIYVHKYILNAWIWSLRNSFIVLLAMAQLLIGIYLVKDAALAVASFVFIVLNKDAMREMVWNAGHIFQCIAEARVASRRMFEMFDENVYPIEKFGKKELKKCTGEIEFKNVSFSYIKQGEANSSTSDANQPAAENVRKNILNDLSFKIQKNKTVAFVGKSGSGKTTILNLIIKLFETDTGEVLIDGVNINDLNKQSLRRHISLVNQFPYIFDTSIKKNLLMAKEDATKEELENVLKQASLYNYVNTLPDGIDTIAGENGVKLSGGQRQRLAIARALLRGSKIILFDESTSSLDNHTQKEIKASIESLAGGHTVIIVAHRLSTIRNCDEIFFLSDGKIIDRGKFATLSRRNEAFKNLFKNEK